MLVCLTWALIVNGTSHIVLSRPSGSLMRLSPDSDKYDDGGRFQVLDPDLHLIWKTVILLTLGISALCSLRAWRQRGGPCRSPS